MIFYDRHDFSSHDAVVACHILREFALAVPPIGGLAAAQTLLRPYGSRRVRLYCKRFGSEVWSPEGGVGGTQRLPHQKMKKLSQNCKVTLQK